MFCLVMHSIIQGDQQHVGFVLDNTCNAYVRDTRAPQPDLFKTAWQALVEGLSGIPKATASNSEDVRASCQLARRTRGKDGLGDVVQSLIMEHELQCTATLYTSIQSNYWTGTHTHRYKKKKRLVTVIASS